jgi:hypothetical protein
MNANKPAVDDKKATTIVANDPDDLEGTLKRFGGSQSDHWNTLLANQAIQTLWLKHSDQETRDRQMSATVAAMGGIGPKDELEGMMAAQLLAAHNAAMECYRRAWSANRRSRGDAPRPTHWLISARCLFSPRLASRGNVTNKISYLEFKLGPENEFVATE